MAAIVSQCFLPTMSLPDLPAPVYHRAPGTGPTRSRRRAEGSPASTARSPRSTTFGTRLAQSAECDAPERFSQGVTPKYWSSDTGKYEINTHPAYGLVVLPPFPPNVHAHEHARSEVQPGCEISMHLCKAPWRTCVCVCVSTLTSGQQGRNTTKTRAIKMSVYFILTGSTSVPGLNVQKLGPRL